ncbi:MAG: hypothetical protein ACYCTV_03185 [Leptospirales bacterium]
MGPDSRTPSEPGGRRDLSRPSLSILHQGCPVRWYYLCLSCHRGGTLLRERLRIFMGTGRLRRQPQAGRAGSRSLGAEIAGDERTCLDPDPVVSLPSTFFLGPDGTGIPMRAEEFSGWSGKQEDGSAKTREVNLCVFWRAETTDGKAFPSGTTAPPPIPPP